MSTSLDTTNVAFDLDGVFIPDMHFKQEDLDKMIYARTNFLKPLFSLIDFDYFIITGRPIEAKIETLTWLFESKLKPKKVFHDCPNIKYSSEYKIKVLNDNPQITLFIESDMHQVIQIREKINKCIIVHFETFLVDSLKNLVLGDYTNVRKN
jgi:hypothetical protein